MNQKLAKGINLPISCTRCFRGKNVLKFTQPLKAIKNWDFSLVHNLQKASNSRRKRHFKAWISESKTCLGMGKKRRQQQHWTRKNFPMKIETDKDAIFRVSFVDLKKVCTLWIRHQRPVSRFLRNLSFRYVINVFSASLMSARWYIRSLSSLSNEWKSHVDFCSLNVGRHGDLPRSVGFLRGLL